MTVYPLAKSLQSSPSRISHADKKLKGETETRVPLKDADIKRDKADLQSESQVQEANIGPIIPALEDCAPGKIKHSLFSRALVKIHPIFTLRLLRPKTRVRASMNSK